MAFVPAMVERLNSRRQWLATGSVVLIAAWLSYHVIFGANGMLAYRQKVSEYRELQQEVQQVQAENESLQTRIKALKTDPQAIEKEAREQLKYARPGDVVYMLAAPKPQTPAVATAEKR